MPCGVKMNEKKDEKVSTTNMYDDDDGHPLIGLSRKPEPKIEKLYMNDLGKI